MLAEPGHHPHHPGPSAEPNPWLQAAPPLLVIAVLALGYVVAALRARTGPRDWSRWRTVAWLLGAAVAAVAVTPALADNDPRVHMARHLLLGMFAPLGLVLAAPVTLLLRVTHPTTRRRIGRILRSRPVHVLGHPATAALLSIGGLYLVMLALPPQTIATHSLLLHAVHLHYLAAGYLFTWSIIGPDPAPRRPGMPTRTIVSVLAAAAHAILAKILYADALTVPATADPNSETLRAAARLMYYGGDLAELTLATVLFTTWYRRATRSSITDG